MKPRFILWALSVTAAVILLPGSPCAAGGETGMASSPGEGSAAPADAARIVPLIAIYCLTIVAASLAGGWLPSFVRLTHNRMQMLISFVGGLMLGIGVFHLLPHAAAAIDVDSAVLWMMLGIVTMFFLLRFFHFHQHEPVEMSAMHSAASSHSGAASQITQGPDDAGHHAHHHVHNHTGQVHRFSWVGIALGLGIHTLIDGVALGASVRAEALHNGSLALLGFATFLAIVLHKPLDAVSITSLMQASGWSLRARNLVNGAFAMMCPLGAVLFLLGVEQFAGYREAIVGAALGFSAGVFVCIALSDLLPEMELHSHNRLQLSAAMLSGIVLAWLLVFLEPGHEHSEAPPEHHHSVHQ